MAISRQVMPHQSVDLGGPGTLQAVLLGQGIRPEEVQRTLAIAAAEADADPEGEGEAEAVADPNPEPEA